ncbi:MAG: M24 family metallopeptidase, partial [Pseudomonadota bacterium]
ITRDLRMIKSVAELGKITQAVEIAGRAFARVGEVAAPGRALSDVFRRFQMLCLDEGADWVPYLAGAAGPDGYADVISPATDAPLAEGDVLMLDTGLVWDGYFCDYDRNFGIGSVGPEIRSAHAMLIEATEAAREIATPSVTMAELYRAMDRILNLGPEAGRLGHGLGMQLTEWPSILPFDHTPAAPGMVLTLEPYVATRDGHILVHEENIVIEEGGARYLSTPAAREIRLLG